MGAAPCASATSAGAGILTARDVSYAATMAALASPGIRAWPVSITQRPGAENVARREAVGDGDFGEGGEA